MQKILIAIIGTVVILVGAVIILKDVQGTGGKYGDVTNFNPLPYTPTSTGILCGTTPTLLLDTSSAGRPFVSISNISSQNIYLGFNNTAVLYTGLTLQASTTVQLSQLAIPYNAVYCIAASSASTTLSAVN